MTEAQFRRLMRLFVAWCRQEFGFELYRYQLRVAEACLRSLFVEPRDVYVKIARQSGKTEAVTLLVRFLIIFHRQLRPSPLMCGIASPKGEQAKTDVDRIKKSIRDLRDRWQVEDKEFNAVTIRAYRGGELSAEVFRFSLAPTTSNESKSLNLLIVEEAHKADDRKRSDELDPMLASTNGVKWMIGVGNVRYCDYKRGCDGLLPNSVAIVVPAAEVIADRRAAYEATGDEGHLAYERFVAQEEARVGRDNPQFRLNFLLEDIVEIGMFVSRERLLSCARPAGAAVPSDQLYFGVDWGRRRDHTWAFVTNQYHDVVDMLRVPHMNFEEQNELINAWLTENDYARRVYAVRGDATSIGEMPMEFLQAHTALPIDETSHVKFTMQANNDLYLHFQECLYREPGDPLRFSYPSDHPLTPEFEAQMTCLQTEYKGDGEYLSVHGPEDDPDQHDDAPDACALSLFASKTGTIGEILIA